MAPVSRLMPPFGVHERFPPSGRFTCVGGGRGPATGDCPSQPVEEVRRAHVLEAQTVGGCPAGAPNRSGAGALASPAGPARPPGALAVGFALAVLLSACGRGVGPYLGAGAAVQAGSQGRPTTGSVPAAAAPGAAPGASSGGASAREPPCRRGPTAARSGSSAPGSAAPGAPPSPQAFSFDPCAEAAACHGGANTASDAGVTPTQISIGNVSGLTGPLADSFNQGREAVSALFAAIDAAGGICGRKLKLVPRGRRAERRRPTRRTPPISSRRSWPSWDRHRTPTTAAYRR